MRSGGKKRFRSSEVQEFRMNGGRFCQDKVRDKRGMNERGSTVVLVAARMGVRNVMLASALSLRLLFQPQTWCTVLANGKVPFSPDWVIYT
jgi:hypothetical protein